MRKIYLFLFFCLTFCFAVKAQGNLQFSKVLTYSGSTNSQTLTVPTGTTWKIENVCLNYASGTSMKFILNTVPVFVVYTTNMCFGPVWLKAGDTISVDVGSNNTSNAYMISIIEFKIVP